MLNKNRLRKKYLKIRRQKYFEITPSFFDPIIYILKKKKYKKINLSIYYPAYYEVNILKLFESKVNKMVNTLLPVIEKNGSMHFFKWKEKEVLKINTYGMLEPEKKNKPLVPQIMIVPLLSYDNNKNRIGYGGGYYDRYLKKYLKSNKDITTLGLAFSFQKNKKIPVNDLDIKLDYILTEKGLF